MKMDDIPEIDRVQLNERIINIAKNVNPDDKLDFAALCVVLGTMIGMRCAQTDEVQYQIGQHLTLANRIIAAGIACATGVEIETNITESITPSSHNLQ